MITLLSELSDYCYTQVSSTVPSNVRLLEDGTPRILEDNTFRILES